MQIRRIEVKDFRKLSHVVVEDLQDGLNVLVGDNEAGKSTLLAALRAGLFERHRVGGDVAAGMLPYGQLVRPEVSIDFDLQGKRWQLRKAFCQRQEAELIGPGERATGDAVEERLAQLFGFTPPGKGKSKPEEHQGIYGLLWVEQGGSHRSLGVGAGRDSIASALELEVGQVMGGERGRALLAAAEERRNSSWDKRGNARGAYKLLTDEVAGLELRLVELTSALAAYDGKISTLAAKNDALARHAHDDRLSKAVQSVVSAKEAVRRSEQLNIVLKTAAAELDRRRLERGAVAEKVKARDKLIIAVEKARTAMEEVQAEAEEGRGLLSRHEVSAAAAEANFEKARKSRQEADNLVRAIEQAIARRQAAAFLKKLEEQLVTANDAAVKRRELIAVAEGISVRKDDIVALEKRQSEHDRARLQLDAASVQIMFEPDGHRSVNIDGELHNAGQPLRLSRDALVDLEGFGRLRIHPGGGVDALRQAAEAAARSLADHLSKLGFADIADAREALARRTTVGQGAVALEKTIAALAPQGLDALRQAVESQRVLAARPVADALSAPGDVSEAMLEEAARALHAAREAEKGAEVAVNATRRVKEETGRRVATLTERAAAAHRQHESTTQELGAARWQASDGVLQSHLSQSDEQVGAAEAEHARAKAAVEVAEPEAVMLELQRAEKAEGAIRSDIETLTREKRDLEVELRALGRDGLGEQLAEVEGQLAEARKRYVARHAEATAARLLHDTLAQAQRETKDRWLGPVRERVKPYLKLIQPGSDIVLNEETLEIEHFVRNGVNEPFHSLSVGAREQVAVITRLALADILRASGQPSAIILDDALVNTDEGRLERMHLVLHKAAQALQILVLTCRERDFLQLGAPIKRI